MSDYPSTEPPADREAPGPGFAEGEAAPEAYPEDDRVGRFSEGQEELGEEDSEKHREGRFSEGQEELGEEDPEKHIKGSFETGEDDAP